MDGSLGSTTALFCALRRRPSTSGLLRTPEDSLRAWIGAADSAGLQVAVHAIGERANGFLLDIYDSVARAHGQRDRRFRVEHAQHLRRSDIARFGRGGIIASMQPVHLFDDGDWAEADRRPIRPCTPPHPGSRTHGVAFGSDRSVAPRTRSADLSGCHPPDRDGRTWRPVPEKRSRG
jgi:predicted amidohydrolase YtcJ